MPSDLEARPRIPVHWTGAAHIQPWRLPEREIWTRLGRPHEDLTAILALLYATEPQALEALGRVERLEGLDLMQGEGAGWAMPVFTSGGAGRFNTDAFGCFYVARELETAVAETVYHQERFLRDAGSSSSEVPMRVLRADIAAEAVLDLFDVDPSDPVYDAEHHGASRALGTWAHRSRLDGIHYRSVRRPPHPCLALYVPSRIVRCVSAERLAYRWDGESMHVEKRISLEW